MNTAVNTHPVLLRAPYFNGGSTAALHRYFEPEFIQRFQRDLQRQQISPASLDSWKAEDSFSRHDNTPVLRLPMHKSFYLVSCEVVCDRLGRPALDPQKIKSAGFVIRRIGKNGEQSWMLDDDEVMGWEPSPTGLRDPDVNRRLCCDQARKLAGLPKADAWDQPTTYTGELTHPLHPMKTYDTKGRCHTVLYGYVPLGGTYLFRQTEGKAVFDADSLNNFSAITAAQLPWPFGFKPTNGHVDKTWTVQCTRPVAAGIPTMAFFELLKIIISRYHLGEKNISDNIALETWATRQGFYQETTANKLSPNTFNDSTRANFSSARKLTFRDWLTSLFENENNPLVTYMAQQEKRIDAGYSSLQALPEVNGYSLYITPGDAQELRTLLDQRVLNHALGKVREIPLPKFNQAKEDVYQIIPFVRVLDDCGKEQVVWADNSARSSIFRVAAPFDPNASRPSLIQMPSLADLKGGLARGVSMITPPDTFGLLNALNLKKGASEDVLPSGPTSSMGIQWICSFSLPVITLVAMIMLMIMISLLNIVFFWLPWVRICLPFPSIKKD